MNFLNPGENAEKIPPAKGKLLIATPFLSDSTFSRSVVLLCEHGPDGTLGFVLNQMTDYTLGDLVANIGLSMPPLGIYNGGPVQKDTLHIMHRMPEVLGGVLIAPGIYWGGSYETLQEIVKQNEYKESDLRLFLGYSGWSLGQLDAEMEEGSWLVGEPTAELVFDAEPHTIWKTAISQLGKNFSVFANMPIDPQLN